MTIKEPVAAVLTLELERLDSLMAKPYQAALNGDLQALNSVLNIMSRRARYLGLDAPTKSLNAFNNVSTPPLPLIDAASINASIDLPAIKAAVRELLDTY